MSDSMEDAFGGYPALQICGPYGSITIRGSVLDVTRVLRDMRDSNDPIIQASLKAVEVNVNDLAGGKSTAPASTPAASKPSYSGQSKFPPKRTHPEGQKCSHGEVVVEQYNGKTGDGYWVCGATKTYNPNKECSFKDESNQKKA